MKTFSKGLMTIIVLIGITSAALAYLGAATLPTTNVLPPASQGDGTVSVTTKLGQEKVLVGSDGKVSVALTLKGSELSVIQTDKKDHVVSQPVDLVVVLDRSGSMQGQKISDARTAVLQLMERLTPRDRLGIVTYSDHVEIITQLVAMQSSSQERLRSAIRQIHAGGGTNLGGGLQQGIAMLANQYDTMRQRRVILISDGLANQGVVAPSALGSIAANATERQLAVSTVGVGYDFNELLMTTIADHGGGNYYFLENPQYFAEVFEKEFETSRNIVAGNLELRVPLTRGIDLVGAGGYPISRQGNIAVVHPGDLLAGQERNIFLTYHVPTAKAAEYFLEAVEVQYRQGDEIKNTIGPGKLTVACVEDKKAVVASIDEKVWADQVVQEEYSRLKEKVATAIRSGKKEEALQSIHAYETANRSINDSVGSAEVSKNLDEDVQELRQNVEGTFAGAPAAVELKKKQQAKALQYQSYKIRRDK